MSASDAQPIIDSLHRTRAYRNIARAWQSPVALACSGGGDSLALLLMAARARRAGSVAPCVVVHVDHRARSGSYEEQRQVARWARAVSLPFVGTSVLGGNDRNHGSPEATLRDQRYEALARVVSALRLSAVVTGHTRDDQIETMLMRLIDGSGALGLLGMSPATQLGTPSGAVHIRRPLLDVTRDELRDVCRAAGVEPIEDPSNADLDVRRNAIRHRLIPVLRDIDPGFDKGIRRAVDLAARDQEYADEAADREYAEIVSRNGSRMLVARARLRCLHVALSSRIVRQAILELEPELGRELPFERVDAVVRAADGRTGAVVELGSGLQARVDREEIVIVRAE